METETKYLYSQLTIIELARFESPPQTIKKLENVFAAPSV